MAYPTGVSLAIIEVGQAGTFFGDDASITAKVTPVLAGTPYIAHTASGAIMVPAPNTFTAAEGGTLSFSVPHTDQDGWLDAGGNAFTGWAYRVDITIRIGGGSKATTHSWVKNVQPIVGQDLIDLDLVADGAIGEPVSAPLPEVLSVNGQTGHVTLEAGGTTLTEDPALPGTAII